MPKRKGNVYSDERLQTLLRQARQHERDELACKLKYLLDEVGQEQERGIAKLSVWLDGMNAGHMLATGEPHRVALWRNDLHAMLAAWQAVRNELA